MALVVQKFGGTSVGNVERIKNVARRVAGRVKQGDKVAVVVSAMSGETNRLLDLCKQVSSRPDPRECDMTAATGEQVTIGLTALALRELGVNARSYTGQQIGMLTSGAFMHARIDTIDSARILGWMEEGITPVIAGFQGVTRDGDITTLGRGGSDTSAVAIAAAIDADVCEIYTDVDGVFTTDPNIYNKARKIDRISFEEMLEMASLGAKVLQTRSVELAARYHVPLWVLNSFNNNPGTFVTDEEPDMENMLVTAIAYSKDDCKILVRDIPDQPGIAARIFKPLADAGINVDMIVQNIGWDDGKTDLTFTVPEGSYDRALDLIQRIGKEFNASAVTGDKNVAKVSAVGLGMRTHAGVALTMFETLSQAGINIQMISTSEIKISVVIDRHYMELAVRVLHDAFHLELPPGEASRLQREDVKNR
ncbi:MAG: Aspartate kinase Ask_LysC [Myxococcota bacterium]|nr:Aspartate kinase Ask_LysC [Myxococcota bacterium]